MKYIDIKIKGLVESRSMAHGKNRAPGDAVLVNRGVPRILLLKCPCGCGDDIPINLDSRAGKAWRIYFSEESGLSVYPSVWLDTGCESHFIIWRNKILLFDSSDNNYFSQNISLNVPELAEKLDQVWPNSGLVQYSTIADQIGEIPWDVLQACRYLVRNNVLIEGTGQQQGMFKRKF